MQDRTSKEDDSVRDSSEALITKVSVEGFRSLRRVSVELESGLTVLVGPNGAGKSAFIDVLAFLQEALATSPQDAFKSRGGIDQVRTRTQGGTLFITIRVEVHSRHEGQFSGEYLVRFRSRPSKHTFVVTEEACTVSMAAEAMQHRFVVRESRWLESTVGATPQLAGNRLALPLLSGTAYFAPIYTALTSLHFYAVDPGAVAAVQEPDDGVHLAPDGSNAASVLKRLRTNNEWLYEKVVQGIGLIVPEVRMVTPKTRGRRQTISFDELFEDKTAVAYDARYMSAGTLRILALLLAAYQAKPPTLVGLEEPETALHPGTAEALAGILREAALRLQILITTHSPALINHVDVATLRAVARLNGQTVISAIDEAQRQVIREGLFDPGELHRFDGLRPSSALLAEVAGDA